MPLLLHHSHSRVTRRKGNLVLQYSEELMNVTNRLWNIKEKRKEKPFILKHTSVDVADTLETGLQDL